MSDDRERVPLIDYDNVHDVFCCGIAQIERLPGDNLRFVIYTEHVNPESGLTERSAVVRMIWPRGAAAEAVQHATRALEESDRHTFAVPSLNRRMM